MMRRVKASGAGLEMLTRIAESLKPFACRCTYHPAPQVKKWSTLVVKTGAVQAMHKEVVLERETRTTKAASMARVAGRMTQVTKRGMMLTMTQMVEEMELEPTTQRPAAAVLSATFNLERLGLSSSLVEDMPTVRAQRNFTLTTTFPHGLANSQAVWCQHLAGLATSREMRKRLGPSCQ